MDYVKRNVECLSTNIVLYLSASDGVLADGRKYVSIDFYFSNVTGEIRYIRNASRHGQERFVHGSIRVAYSDGEESTEIIDSTIPLVTENARNVLQQSMQMYNHTAVKVR